MEYSIVQSLLIGKWRGVIRVIQAHLYIGHIGEILIIQFTLVMICYNGSTTPGHLVDVYSFLTVMAQWPSARGCISPTCQVCSQYLWILAMTKGRRESVDFFSRLSGAGFSGKSLYKKSTQRPSDAKGLVGSSEI